MYMHRSISEGKRQKHGCFVQDETSAESLKENTKSYTCKGAKKRLKSKMAGKFNWQLVLLVLFWCLF